MKRKIIAFPPAPPKANAVVPSCSIPPAHVAKGVDSGIQSAVRAEDLKTLLSLLPEKHLLSLELQNQLSSLTLQNGLSPSIRIDSSHNVSPGLLEVGFTILKPAESDTSYDFSPWIVQIGGEGPGLEEIAQFASIQDSQKAPVAVRFAVPISHPLVDDIGFVDSALWSNIPSASPTLVQILNMLADILVSPAPIIDENYTELVIRYQESWASAQRHTLNKYTLMREFHNIAKHPHFLGNRLSCDSLTVASWLQPEFVDMIGKLKVALFDASRSDPQFNPSDTNITALMNYTHAKHVVSAWIGYVTENSEGIFSFDMFTKQFCDSFVEELALYEQSSLPRRRPNTMNNYGLILNDIGMYGLMTTLMTEYLTPLVQVLYSEEPVAYGLDHHHSFIVQYKRSSAEVANSTIANALPIGDKGLDMHHDSSEVTVNVCLGKEGFVGGGLRFCGLKGNSDYRNLQFTLKHVIGRAVVHLGRHRHGADDLLLPTVVLPAAAAVTHTVDAALGATDCTHADNTTASPIPTTTTTTTATSSIPVATDNTLVSERLNLIMWLRSSAFRGAAAYGRINPDGFPKSPENGAPDVCCLSKFNDADYVLQLEKAIGQGKV